jgi:hypothetical protein
MSYFTRYFIIEFMAILGHTLRTRINQKFRPYYYKAKIFDSNKFTIKIFFSKRPSP